MVDTVNSVDFIEGNGHIFGKTPFVDDEVLVCGDDVVGVYHSFDDDDHDEQVERQEDAHSLSGHGGSLPDEINGY